MSDTETKVQRKSRSRSDLRAEREIKAQQAKANNAIPYACFKRLARQTLDRDVPCAGEAQIRLAKSGVLELQEKAELHLIEHLQAARVCSHHKKRRMLMRDDLWAAQDVLRVYKQKLPQHEADEPASRRKRRASQRVPSAQKKARLEKADALQRELEELLEEGEALSESEKEEESPEKEREVEREDSTDFCYEREEASDMY